MRKIKVSEEELNMIQAFRSSKPQTQGTADASGNNGSTPMTTPVVGTGLEPPKRTYKIQPLSKVLRKAKRLYYSQVDKSVENKIKCIETALASYNNLYPDALRFEMDFRQERDRLVDSTRFCNACMALGLSCTDVADHVVFEGKGIVEKVLKEGLQVVGEKVHMFNKPLWKDTESLYKAKPQNGVSKVDTEKKDAYE